MIMVDSKTATAGNVSGRGFCVAIAFILPAALLEVNESNGPNRA
jgi:hypothetical protein